MTLNKISLILFLVCCFAISTNAQQLVFEFVNPNFGGKNTYNYNWLLSQAQAQNNITEDGALSRYYNDPLADFQESLNRQILSQLSRQLVQNTFGDTEFMEGRYELGNYVIDITPGSNGIQVTIFDVFGGGETTITVPYL